MLNRLNVSDNQGIGITLLTANLQSTATSSHNSIPRGPLDIPYQAPGLLDMCSSGKAVSVHGRMLLFYKYDSLAVDCVKVQIEEEMLNQIQLILRFFVPQMAAAWAFVFCKSIFSPALWAFLGPINCQSMPEPASRLKACYASIALIPILNGMVRWPPNQLCFPCICGQLLPMDILGLWLRFAFCQHKIRMNSIFTGCHVANRAIEQKNG